MVWALISSLVVNFYMFMAVLQLASNSPSSSPHLSVVELGSVAQW